MAATHSIWIPSQQQYVGFGKFTTLHQLQLAQSVELNQTNTSLDFERNLADVISDLSNDVVDGKTINMYDKIAIALQLAIMHVGDINKVHHKCQTCLNANGEPVVTSIKYSLSDILHKLQPTIDVDPRQIVSCSEQPGVMIHLDVIPTNNLLTLLQFQSQLHSTENIEMLCWIRSLIIGDTSLEFHSFTHPQTQEIFNKLSMPILLKVKQYITDHTNASPSLLSLMCGECRAKQDLQFSLTSVPFILRSALHLDLESIYNSVYHLSTIGIDADRLSPAERDVYLKIHQQQNSKQS